MILLIDRDPFNGSRIPLLLKVFFNIVIFVLITLFNWWFSMPYCSKAKIDSGGFT